MPKYRIVQAPHEGRLQWEFNFHMRSDTMAISYAREVAKVERLGLTLYGYSHSLEDYLYLAEIHTDTVTTTTVELNPEQLHNEAQP